jgi:hypothetical protein
VIIQNFIVYLKNRPKVVYERAKNEPLMIKPDYFHEAFKNPTRPPVKKAESKIKPFMMMTDQPTFQMRQEF